MEHSPDAAYVVVYCHHQLHQRVGLRHNHLENNGSLPIHTPPDNNKFEESAQNEVGGEIFRYLEKTYEHCMRLYQFLAPPDTTRVAFLKFAANARYYHSMVVEDMERLDQAGVKVQVDGKNQSQILEELRDLEKQMTEWDYRSLCWSTLNRPKSTWDSVNSPLYIALPSDLNS